MVRWLFTVYGSATISTANSSGDFTVTISDAYGGPYNYIRIPLGFKAKIWAKRLTGTANFRLIVRFIPDVVNAPNTTVDVDSEYLASPGTLELEKRRPIVIVAKTGNEAIKFSYDNTGTGTIAFAADIELTDEEE
jgi:hypothetical protein